MVSCWESARLLQNGTYLDRICIGLWGICLGALKVNAVLGSSMLETRGLESYGGLFKITA